MVVGGWGHIDPSAVLALNAKFAAISVVLLCFINHQVEFMIILKTFMKNFELNLDEINKKNS